MPGKITSELETVLKEGLQVLQAQLKDAAGRLKKIEADAYERSKEIDREDGLTRLRLEYLTDSRRHYEKILDGLRSLLLNPALMSLIDARIKPDQGAFKEKLDNIDTEKLENLENILSELVGK